MKPLLIILMLLLLAPTVIARELDWQLLNKGSEFGLGDDYIEISSLKVSGPVVTYWRRNHFPGAQAYYDKTKRSTLQDTVTQEMVDCKARKSKRIKGIVKYLGTPPKDEKTELGPTEFTVVASDTHNDFLMKKVCALAQKQTSKSAK